MRVLKFGGAALCDGPAIQRAARIVRAETDALVVVSAHQGVTALLERTLETAREGRLDWDPVRIRHRTLLRQLELPADLLDRHLRELRGVLEAVCGRPGSEAGEAGEGSDRGPARDGRRMRDFVLSFGERMSARVFTAALRRAGVDATPLDAFDLGFTIPRARATRPAPPEVGQALRRVPGVAVVTGFLALDEKGHLTTLGRNGSDLSAVWFAEAVGADVAQLWKTVPGMMTADPKRVPDARRLRALGWREAAELARHGSEVLHPGALEPAHRARIRVELRDVGDPTDAGTRIEGRTAVEGPLAVAHHPRLARLRFEAGFVRDAPERLAALAAALREAGAEPYLVGFARAGVVAGEMFLPAAGAPLAATLRPAPAVEAGWASAALVGRGVGRDAALAARIERSARSAGIELRKWEDGRSLVYLTRERAIGELVDLLHGECGGVRRDEPEPDVSLAP